MGYLLIPHRVSKGVNCQDSKRSKRPKQRVGSGFDIVTIQSHLYRSQFRGHSVMLFSPTSWSGRSTILAPGANMSVNVSAIGNHDPSPRLMPPETGARPLAGVIMDASWMGSHGWGQVLH